MDFGTHSPSLPQTEVRDFFIFFFLCEAQIIKYTRSRRKNEKDKIKLEKLVSVIRKMMVNKVSSKDYNSQN